MSPLIQNLIALLLVAACAGYVAWQLLRTIRSGKGKAGACCNKGCGSDEAAASKSPGPREQFIAADSLRRGR